MGPLAGGKVVLVRFPFSGGLGSKLRPALVVKAIGQGVWLLCQITSRPFEGKRGRLLYDSNFIRGSLGRESCVRPDVLFAISERLIVSVEAELRPEWFGRIVDDIARGIKDGGPSC